MPLGQATLYVFLIHVPLLIVLHAAIIRLPAGHPIVVATIAQFALLAVVWAMVRHRVLFSVIPR